MKVVEADDRAIYVKTRLIEINSQANDLIIQNGLLLREYRQNAYFKEDGYKSFDEAIESLQSAGQLDYGPRNARNFIAIVDMIERLALEPSSVQSIGVSKLREIATLPGADDQKRLLGAASEMSVNEVQQEAKRLRDKSLGRDVDPLHPYCIKTTESQRDMLSECLTEARRIYAVSENASDAVVLIDYILAEWHGDKDRYEAEQIQQMQR